MTVSGRIVRELDQYELGELKIGTHKTEYAWDGTDEFGDRLANGVYLYRVIAKDQDGKEYKSYDTGKKRKKLSPPYKFFHLCKEIRYDFQGGS